jgi:hypothetical protein
MRCPSGAARLQPRREIVTRHGELFASKLTGVAAIAISLLHTSGSGAIKRN